MDTDEKQKLFDEQLERWEKDFNENGRVPKAAQKYHPPTLVTVSEKSVRQGEMMLGIFWPSDILKKHGKVIPRKQLKKYVYNGKAYWGIWREPEHGHPIGTIRDTDLGQRQVSKTTEVANTDKKFTRPGEADEVV